MSMIRGLTIKAQWTENLTKTNNTIQRNMGLMKLSKGSDNLGNQKIRKVDKRSLGNKLSFFFSQKGHRNFSTIQPKREVQIPYNNILPIRYQFQYQYKAKYQDMYYLEQSIMLKVWRK